MTPITPTHNRILQKQTAPNRKLKVQMVRHTLKIPRQQNGGLLLGRLDERVQLEVEQPGEIAVLLVLVGLRLRQRGREPGRPRPRALLHLRHRRLRLVLLRLLLLLMVLLKRVLAPEGVVKVDVLEALDLGRLLRLLVQDVLVMPYQRREVAGLRRRCCLHGMLKVYYAAYIDFCRSKLVDFN